MNYLPHWFPKWRLSQLTPAIHAHRETCADCRGKFPCLTMEKLVRQYAWWKKVGKIAS